VDSEGTKAACIRASDDFADPPFASDALEEVPAHFVLLLAVVLFEIGDDAKL
jgi:hypothetical protein